MKAVTYARFSTIHQNDGSIDDQRRACRDYADAHDLTIIHEYADPAISGAAFANRPDARKMQAAAIAGDFKVIIVADLTRLSRNMGELARFLEQMRFRRVQVVGCLDRFDSTQRHSRMQAGMSGMMSDEYRLAVAERVHLALHSRAREGRPTGNNAYGYASDNGIHKTEAPIVREIFKTYASGQKSVRDIVFDLNDRGVPGPGQRGDGRWIVPTLQYMLRNERYAGRVVWNKSQWVKDPETGVHKQRDRPQSEWVIREGIALVDRKTWDTVQVKLAQRRNSFSRRGGAQRKYPLSGLLTCGTCGHILQLIGAGGHRVYCCGNNRLAGPKACTNRLRVSLDVVTERLIEPALEDLLSPAAVERGAARIRAAMREAPVKPSVNLKDLDAKTAKIARLVKSGDLDPDMAEAVFAKLEQERAAVRAAARPRPVGAVFGAEAEFRKQVKTLRRDLAGEDAHAARAALVTIYGPRINCKPNGDHMVAEYPQPSLVQQAAAVGRGGRVPLKMAHPIFTCIPLISKGQK